jgi:hypothetical protein
MNLMNLVQQESQGRRKVDFKNGNESMSREAFDREDSGRQEKSAPRK